MKHDHIPDDVLQTLPESVSTTMNFTQFTNEELAVIKSLAASQKLDATQVLRQAIRHYQMAVQGKPEPTPPVADGKTPGQVAWEAGNEVQKRKFPNDSVMSWEEGGDLHEQLEAAASAVLATFGKQSSLEAAIARMEAVPVNELGVLWDTKRAWFDRMEAIRARLIAAAKEGQAEERSDVRVYILDEPAKESTDWQAIVKASIEQLNLEGTTPQNLALQINKKIMQRDEIHAKTIARAEKAEAVLKNAQQTAANYHQQFQEAKT